MLFAYFPPDYTGAGIQGRLLATRLVARGVDVQVLGPLADDQLGAFLHRRLERRLADGIRRQELRWTREEHYQGQHSSQPYLRKTWNSHPTTSLLSFLHDTFYEEKIAAYYSCPTSERPGVSLVTEARATYHLRLKRPTRKGAATANHLKGVRTWAEGPGSS